MPNTLRRAAQKLHDSWLPVGIAAAALGLLLSAVENVTKAIEILDAHFYLFVWIIYVAALLLVWQWRPKRKKPFLRLRPYLRAIIFAIISAAFVFAAGGRYYEEHLRRTWAAKVPKVFAPPRIHSANFVRPPKPAVSHLVLQSIDLNDEMCSFVEVNQRFFGAGPTCRTFASDYSVTRAFGNGQCVGPRGERPIEEVIPILKQRLEKIGRKDLLPHVENVNTLRKVMQQRGDVFDKVMFTSSDLTNLEENSPNDYKVVYEWLVNCIGLQQPVLTITLRNHGPAPVLLTHMIYHVSNVGEVKGGESGPVVPEKTYDHVLKHEVGDQVVPLKPPFKIAANNVGAFNVRFFSAEQGLGLGWLMQIEVLASDGDSVTTDQIEILMSK